MICREERYTPSPVTARRAADLWRRMVESPIFDNGDRSEQGFFCKAMAESIPTESDEAKLDAFRDRLEAALLDESIRPYDRSGLHVDYHPDEILAQAAEGTKIRFPCKTNMWVYNDHIGVSAGYGAETVNHYPLSEGRWLITTLSGSTEEMAKVIQLVEGGCELFEVEG